MTASPEKAPHAPWITRAVPRLRIVDGDRRLGPGRIELLEAVARTGSISGAGRLLGMSYRRAWLLVDAVNRLFVSPVVETAAGGARGGGARLTPLGAEVAAAYRRVERRTAEAVREEFAALEGTFLPD